MTIAKALQLLRKAWGPAAHIEERPASTAARYVVGLAAPAGSGRRTFAHIWGYGPTPAVAVQAAVNAAYAVPGFKPAVRP
jgi:hypothetical protein